MKPTDARIASECPQLGGGGQVHVLFTAGHPWRRGQNVLASGPNHFLMRAFNEPSFFMAAMARSSLFFNSLSPSRMPIPTPRLNISSGPTRASLSPLSAILPKANLKSTSAASASPLRTVASYRPGSPEVHVLGLSTLLSSMVSIAAPDHLKQPIQGREGSIERGRLVRSLLQRKPFQRLDPGGQCPSSAPIKISGKMEPILTLGGFPAAKSIQPETA